MIEKLNLCYKMSTSSVYTLLPTEIYCSCYPKMTSWTHFQYLLFTIPTTTVLTAFLEPLLCTRHGVVCFTNIISFHNHRTQRGRHYYLSCTDKETESEVNLPKGTQLVCDRARIQTWDRLNLNSVRS